MTTRSLTEQVFNSRRDIHFRALQQSRFDASDSGGFHPARDCGCEGRVRRMRRLKLIRRAQGVNGVKDERFSFHQRQAAKRIGKNGPANPIVLFAETRG